MIERIKKDIINNYKYYIVLIILFIILTIRFDYNIYSPGGLEDLSDRIIVENSYNYKGSFNLTYVTSRRATIPTLILSYIIPSWDIVDIDELRIEDESESDIVERNKIYLKETSYNAVISAYKEANLPYHINSIDVTVTYVYNMSNSDLKVGDIIKSVNGVEISDFNSLKNEITKYKENDKISIKVLRNNKEKECYSILTKEDDRVLIGVTLAEIKSIITDNKIEYVFKDNESGSSRGLLCSLDIYNKITEEDLTKGLKIAGTGSIDADGNVGSISGVKYKLAGAVNKNADIFIVPKDNYEEAIKLKEKYNYNIRIISATNMHQVIEELKKQVK